MEIELNLSALALSPNLGRIPLISASKEKEEKKKKSSEVQSVQLKDCSQTEILPC